MDSNDLLDFDLHYVQNITNTNNKNDIICTNNTNLRILYMNCRSINCRFEEVQNLITSTRKIPDVVAFDETWIKEDSIKFFHMNGYTPFLVGRKDRVGGGVGFLFRNGWGTPRVLEEIMSDIIEGLVVEVKLGSLDFKFVIIYRPPINLNDGLQQMYVERLEQIFY